MNYGELKQAILDDTHRPDQSAYVADFVRQAEGLIRRDLKAYLLSTTLTDSDRVANGLFNLPARLTQIRRIIPQGRHGDDLVRVTPNAIRRLDLTADVLQYAEYGDGTVEFRGNPSADDVFDLLYYGTPEPFTDDSDENTLLTDHETLYMSGAKFFLYLKSQDRELANDHLEIFNGVITTLNDQLAREIGGNTVAPSYNFSGGSAY